MKKEYSFAQIKTTPVLSGLGSESRPMMRGRKPVFVGLVVFLILFGVAYFSDVYSLRAENLDDPPAYTYSAASCPDMDLWKMPG